MNDTDLLRLKQDAQDTLADLDPSKITKDAFLLAGASVAILDHCASANDDKEVESVKPQRNDNKTPNGILDDFSVILSQYGNSRTAADREAMRMTLKQQLSDIERELVEMRHEVHDPECVQMFIEFRENLRLKL